MLVLSRKPGESIQIGDDITITVVRIGPNTVRIGITAPRATNIARSELVIDIQDDGDEAIELQIETSNDSETEP